MDMDKIRKVNEFKYAYPSQLFGTKDRNGRNLKPAAIGTCFDFGQTVGHHFINMKDVKNFISEPVLLTDDKGIRVYEDYTTGRHFEEVTRALREKLGDTKAIVLAVGMTLDAAKLGKSTGSMCPLLIYLPNCANNDYTMHPLGYVPIKLSYSKKQLTTLLKNRGCRSQTKCDSIIQMLSRKIKLCFIHDALEPLLSLGETGMHLMLKDQNQSRIITVHPQLSIITGDNEELHKLAGQSIKAKGSKSGKRKRICRICDSPDCIRDLDWSRGEPGVFRTDAIMNRLGTDGEHLLLRKFRHTSLGHRGGIYKKTTADIRIEKALVDLNHKAGYNPLYKFFAWQNSVNVLSFHQALVPDILHTVLKGIAEYAIHWAWDCITAIGRLDATFGSNCAYFDERLQSFPYIQSFRFFPNCRFRVGLSHFMKENKNASSGTSFSSGGIEAWKLQNLLLQILFCIDHAIVPFDVTWSARHALKYRWNVGRTVVNALASALEIIFSVKAAKLSQAHVESLLALISNGRAHIMLLWCLRKDLLEALSNRRSSSKKKREVETESRLANNGARFFLWSENALINAFCFLQTISRSCLNYFTST
jgi:hypothetical protein